MTKESTNRGAGIIAGIFAAVSFGFIPVFSKPVLAAGVSSTCLLFYRFLFATVMLFALMLMRRESLRIPVRIIPAMLLLAVATSIDAMAVGISLAVLRSPIVLEATIIGIVTLLISAFGVFFGNQVGRRIDLKLDLIGGVILIGLGTKILIEHTVLA